MKRTLLLCTLLSGLSLPVCAFPFAPIDTTAERNIKLPGPVYVPNGCVNLALSKPVTSSDNYPIIGSLGLITDGDKEDDEEHWVELGPGTQWVQIDLGQPSLLFGIQIWHYYGEPRVYRDVVVRVSDDPAFVKGVRTLYNNDQNNSAGLGRGRDKEFYESYRGFLLDTRGKNYEGVTARYVRLYSRGNSSDPQNQYIEVEVIGKPSGAPPLPGDIDARRKRGELKAWPSPLPDRTVQWPAGAGKTSAAREKQFWVPLDAANIEYDGTVLICFPRNGSLQKWWKQIDFGSVRNVYAIQLPDNKTMTPAYSDYLVQAADDEKFTKNVRTLFDWNAPKLLPVIKAYVDMNSGLLIDTRGKDLSGLSTRYLRIYSRNNKISLSPRFDGAIIGKKEPNHAPGRPDLMIWETKLPAQPYW